MYLNSKESEKCFEYFKEHGRFMRENYYTIRYPQTASKCIAASDPEELFNKLKRKWRTA